MVRIRVWGFGVGVSSIAAGPRGRFGGGCQTDDGGRVWAEQWAATVSPVGVVEEVGWVGSKVRERNLWREVDGSRSGGGELGSGSGRGGTAGACRDGLVAEALPEPTRWVGGEGKQRER
jgi:hypothetical protein